MQDLRDQARKYWLLNRLLRHPVRPNKPLALQGIRALSNKAHPLVRNRYLKVLQEQDQVR